MKTTKQKIRFCCTMMYMFFLIFLPNLLNFTARNIFLVLNAGIIAVIFCCKGKVFFDLKSFKIFFGFIPFFIFLFINQILHMVADPENKDIYIHGILAILSPFLYLFIYVLLLLNLKKYYKLKYEYFEMLLIYAALIQLFCCMLAFLVPSVKSLFYEIMLRDWTDPIQKMKLQWESGKRGYGLSNNLFDGFGYIISILICLTMLKGINENKKLYILLSCFMIIMPLLNARTGLVLTFVGFSIIFVSYFDLKKIVIYLAAGAGIVFLVPVLLKFLPEKTMEWIMLGAEQGLSFLSGGSSQGFYGEIFGNDLVIPDNIIFGVGGEPELVEGYKGIDNGYIQCLWRYGVFGSLLLFGGYIYMFVITIINAKEKKYLCLVLSEAIIFFIYLVKLFSITNFGANVVIFGISALLMGNENDYLKQGKDILYGKKSAKITISYGCDSSI